jgi:hypothetical protein
MEHLGEVRIADNVGRDMGSGEGDFEEHEGRVYVGGINAAAVQEGLPYSLTSTSRSWRDARYTGWEESNARAIFDTSQATAG